MNDVNVKDAKAVISVIDNDALNIEIGLNARAMIPNLRVILRIFDEQMTPHINKILNIELTYSASAIALNHFFEKIKQ
jgi:voltage-gated potassium channel